MWNFDVVTLLAGRYASIRIEDAVKGEIWLGG